MRQKLNEKYRPRRLADIVGQPCVRLLKAFAADPFAMCWLLESSGGGTGKTAAAYALAADMGVDPDWGVQTIKASELSVDAVREFARNIHLRPMAGKWKVYVFEELERLHPQAQTNLRVTLETELPSHVVVVATSNGAAGLSKPLLQRFTLLAFSCGECFAQGCEDRIAEIWELENPGRPLPAGWRSWGWNGDEYSMRTALDRMQASMLACCAVA